MNSDLQVYPTLVTYTVKEHASDAYSTTGMTPQQIHSMNPWREDGLFNNNFVGVLIVAGILYLFWRSRD